MKKRIRIRIQTLLLVLALAVLVSCQLQPAFAAEDTAAAEKDANNMPVSVRIAVKYRVDGDASYASADTYVLTAEDENCPMPAGGAGGVMKIKISKPGKKDFGEMIITKPGAYDYTVSRIMTEKKNVKKQNDVYRVRLVALNTGETNLIVKREGEGDKAELIYTDTVETTLFHTPKTGDVINPVILIMLCAIAAAIIIFLLIRARNRKFGS